MPPSTESCWTINCFILEKNKAFDTNTPFLPPDYPQYKSATQRMPPITTIVWLKKMDRFFTRNIPIGFHLHLYIT